MNHQISEIARRLFGLRDMLGLKPGQVAEICNIPESEYLSFENAEKDIPVSVLLTISKHFKIELTALLFGEEPNMKTFFLTRAGQGTAMERTHLYKYQALASGFAGRKADPFIVTVEPTVENMHLNSHSGQEFNLVLDGKLLLNVGGHELTLDKGDSLYFDASLPHGMKALDGNPAKFLAIIL